MANDRHTMFFMGKEYPNVAMGGGSGGGGYSRTELWTGNQSTAQTSITLDDDYDSFDVLEVMLGFNPTSEYYNKYFYIPTEDIVLNQMAQFADSSSTNTENLGLISFHFTAKDTLYIDEIYTKNFTSPRILKVSGIKYGSGGGGSGSSGINYSTDEQVIGTWIDGKPLYQKTIVANNKRMGHPESDSEILHGVNNIEFGFVEKCLFNQSDGNGYVDGTVVVSSVNQQVYTQSFAVGSSKIYSTKEPFSANTNRTWIITIRYTKTTD